MNVIGSMRRVFEERALIVSASRRAAGEAPQLTFSRLRDFYLSDADAYAAVNFLANRAISPGIYFTLNRKSSKADVIYDLIDTFNDKVKWGDRRAERGLDGLLRIIFRELLWGGNSFVEMVTPDNLESLHQLQLSSLQRIRRDRIGQVQEIILQIEGEEKVINPEIITHFAWNIVDRSPFGYGLIYSLAVDRTDLYGKRIPPLFELINQIEQDSRRAIHRYGTPRSIYSFKGIGKEVLKEYGEQLKDPEADASFATNVEVDVRSDSPDPRARFDAIIDYFAVRKRIGLQTAINIILSDPGKFSEASARVAAELGDVIVDDLWRLVKRVIEHEWYERILEQAGIDPKEARIELHRGDPDKPQYSVADILRIRELDIQAREKGLQPLVTEDQMLEMLRDVGLKIPVVLE